MPKAKAQTMLFPLIESSFEDFFFEDLLFFFAFCAIFLIIYLLYTICAKVEKKIQLFFIAKILYYFCADFLHFFECEIVLT